MVNRTAATAVLVVAMGFAGTMIGTGCNKSAKPGGGAGSASAQAKTTPSGSASAAQEDFLKDLDAGKVNRIKQLPGIQELQGHMKSAGIADKMIEAADPKLQEFDKLPEGERALAVGQYLADLALVSFKDEVVPTTTLEDAQKAIGALEPPAEVTALIGDVVDASKKEDADAKKLRQQVDAMIAKGIPMMEQDKKMETTARLVRVGAFLRTMALASSELTGETEKKKLDALQQQADVEVHLEFFHGLSKELMENDKVAAAKAALEALKPLVAKKEISQDDAKAIAEALKAYA